MDWELGVVRPLSEHLGGAWGIFPASCFPGGKGTAWAGFWGMQSIGGGNRVAGVGVG